MMVTTARLECIVQIGDVAVALRTDDPSFLDLLRERYAGFLSSSQPELALDFDLASTGMVSNDDVRVCRVGAEWQLERGDFRARWDPLSGRGHVRQNPNPYALDSVLRILHSLVLAARGGFLLHAASGIYDGQAYLFSGESGAGKTTLTRLAPLEITLLTDEISYVQPSPLGYVAHGTPFSGDLAKAGQNTSAPVSGLFFLEKGPENRVDELPPADAVRRLMRNILFFAADPALVEGLFATACDFVQRVPVRRLTFYPDSKVWDDIRNFGRIPAHA